MRIWHYKLIPFLPTKQLKGQWSELNSIFTKQDNHILINYIYEYPKENLKYYTDLLLVELLYRGVDIKTFNHYFDYFDGVDTVKMGNPFPQHHTDRYLLQCFYNLQEKYDRGQDDFPPLLYRRLKHIAERVILKHYTGEIE